MLRGGIKQTGQESRHWREENAVSQGHRHHTLSSAPGSKSPA